MVKAAAASKVAAGPGVYSATYSGVSHDQACVNALNFEMARDGIKAMRLLNQSVQAFDLATSCLGTCSRDTDANLHLYRFPYMSSSLEEI